MALAGRAGKIAYLVSLNSGKEFEMRRGKNHFMKAGLLLLIMALILVIPLSAALAANPPGTGQPGQDCAVAGVTPGNAASASGSAFNPNGVAGTVYAGEQPQNSNNPKSVSQYDVACFQVSQP